MPAALVGDALTMVIVKPVCLEFEHQVNDVAIAKALLKEHLVVRPLSTVCANTDQRSGLIMGVGMLSGETLTNEAKRLCRHLKILLLSKSA